MHFQFNDEIYWDIPSDMYDLFPKEVDISCRWNFDDKNTVIFNSTDTNKPRYRNSIYWEYVFPWLPFDIDKGQLQRLMLLL